ncbi:MAG: addiction module protein [Acidobacteriota bacterium]
MTKTDVMTQALQLSERERLQVAAELWASVPDPNAYPEALPLPAWQAQLLDQRLEELERQPEEGTPWEEVERRIWPEE